MYASTSWSCFHGDKTAFLLPLWEIFISTPILMKISKGKSVFVSIFFPISYYDKLVDTINHNDYEAEEFSAGKFTLINAKTIHAPMIQEAFINIECTLKETQDLSGAGITSMIIGQVQHISVEEEYAQGYENRYGKRMSL